MTLLRAILLCAVLASCETPEQRVERATQTLMRDGYFVIGVDGEGLRYVVIEHGIKFHFYVDEHGHFIRRERAE